MSPATILLIIQFVQAGIAAAPEIEAEAVRAKQFFTELFGKGLISKAQQDAVHAHIDALEVAVKANAVPPEFVVEADPV